VIPAAAGVIFLASLAARRPLIAVAARRWPWLTGRPPAQARRRAVTGLTALWGIGVLAAGTAQGIGAVTAGLAITNPASFGGQDADRPGRRSHPGCHHHRLAAPQDRRPQHASPRRKL
jgi:hypothetical protein